MFSNYIVAYHFHSKDGTTKGTMPVRAKSTEDAESITIERIRIKHRYGVDVKIDDVTEQEDI